MDPVAPETVEEDKWGAGHTILTAESRENAETEIGVCGALIVPALATGEASAKSGNVTVNVEPRPGPSERAAMRP